MRRVWVCVVQWYGVCLKMFEGVSVYDSIWNLMASEFDFMQNQY